MGAPSHSLQFYLPTLRSLPIRPSPPYGWVPVTAPAIEIVNVGGRPTLYRQEYNQRAYRYCLLGATDAQVADYLDVSPATIDLWKAAHPRFLGAIKRGRIEADSKVALSLYNKAKGARWTEQQALVLKRVEYDAHGKRTSEDQRVETVEVTREAPPDTAAAFIWLKNRQPQLWRDRKELDVTSGGQSLEALVLGAMALAAATTIERLDPADEVKQIEPGEP